MTLPLTVVGVPTSAGAHHAGQELAPAALRARGFVDKLSAAGLVVTDAGDVAGEVFAPDDVAATARNLDAVVAVALAVADAVEQVVRAGRMPIVLGGDCTITLGVVAGLQRVRDEVRLAYFDGDADLNSPKRTRSGILDATGVATCWVLPTPRWPGSGGRFRCSPRTNSSCSATTPPILTVTTPTRWPPARR